jgi:micrococcal nuclease
MYAWTNPTAEQAATKVEAKPQPVVSYTYKAELVRVVDGDTIDVRIDLGFSVWVAQRLRLLNTYAAESKSIDGPAHTANLQTLLTEAGPKVGGLIVSTVKDRKDKYGRTLADVWCKKVHVNSEQMKFIGTAQGKGLNNTP